MQRTLVRRSQGRHTPRVLRHQGVISMITLSVFGDRGNPLITTPLLRLVTPQSTCLEEQFAFVECVGACIVRVRVRTCVRDLLLPLPTFDVGMFSDTIETYYTSNSASWYYAVLSFHSSSFL